ncbi:hypothetical protein D3C85_463430 [compost metagenome]
MSLPALSSGKPDRFDVLDKPSACSRTVGSSSGFAPSSVREAMDSTLSTGSMGASCSETDNSATGISSFSRASSVFSTASSPWVPSSPSPPTSAESLPASGAASAPVDASAGVAPSPVNCCTSPRSNPASAAAAWADSRGGSSSSARRPRSSRNWRVVPNSAGRPGASRCPITSIHPLSSKAFTICDDTVTPRMSSISPRVTGWRQATMASVSMTAREYLGGFSGLSRSR